MATDETLHNRFVAATLEVSSGKRRIWRHDRGIIYGYTTLTVDEAAERLRKHGYQVAFADDISKTLVKFVSAWIVQVVSLTRSNQSNKVTVIDPAVMTEEEWLQMLTRLRNTADILNKAKNTAG